MVFTIGQPEELDEAIRFSLKRGEAHLVWNRIVWRTIHEAEEALGNHPGEVYAVLAAWERMKPMNGSPARLLRRKAPIIKLLPNGKLDGVIRVPAPPSPALVLEGILLSQGLVVQ